MGRVLVVDEEAEMHRVLAANLGQDQHTLSHAWNVADARQAIRGNQLDVIITGPKMADGDGRDVLAAARETDSRVSVILLAGVDKIDPSPEDMPKGAFDVLPLLFTPEMMRATVNRASEHTSLLRENDQLKAEVERLKSTEKAATAQETGNGNHKVEIGWIESLPPSFDLRGLLATLEKSLIERTIQSTGGAQAEAARRLGLSRSDLSYKLLKYELRKETTAAS